MRDRRHAAEGQGYEEGPAALPRYPPPGEEAGTGAEIAPLGLAPPDSAVAHSDHDGAAYNAWIGEVAARGNYVDIRRGEIDARTGRVVAPIPDFYRKV